MIFAALVLPGLVVAYVLFIRPELRAMPRFKELYAQADGFWAKVWALCGKSLTMAFSYFIQALSWALQWVDPIATFFGDPDMRQQLTETLKADPKILGYVLMAVSAVTIAARVHGLATKDAD
jgi:hypothetical protein